MDDHDAIQFQKACGVGGPLCLHIGGADDQEIARLILPQPFALVGRDANTDLSLNHPHVSRRHAFLQAIAGRVFCFDLHSRTGVRWNGASTRSGWLGAGQVVSIGPYTIRAEVSRTPEAPQAEPDWNPTTPKHARQEGLPEVALEFLNGQTRQPFWPVRSALILIGRLPGCQVRLVEPSVSRFHCALLRTLTGLWVVDLLGRGGIRINGDRYRYSPLEDGDQLQVGRFQLRVHVRAPSPGVAQLTGEPSVAVSGLAAPLIRRDLPSPALAGPADLTALSQPSLPQTAHDLVPITATRELVRTESSESLLMPLMSQFGQMQQQMFDQFQQSVLMMVQMFSALHRDQMGIIREELDRLHQLTQELKGLQTELARQPASGERSAEKPAITSDDMAAELLERVKSLIQHEQGPANGPPSAPVPSPAAVSLPRPEIPKPAVPPPMPPLAPQPAPAATGLDGSPAQPNQEIHAWLHQRIAAIQQERESRWQKILQFMLGK